MKDACPSTEASGAVHQKFRVVTDAQLAVWRLMKDDTLAEANVFVRKVAAE